MAGAVLIELLILMAAVMLAAIYLANKFNGWINDRHDQQAAAQLQIGCYEDLNRVIDMVVRYESSQNKTRQQCQAVNILINAWNMRCADRLSMAPIPALSCDDAE